MNSEMSLFPNGPLSVLQSIQQYIKGRLNDFHIGDRIKYRRCDHFTGKNVVGLDEYMTRI